MKEGIHLGAPRSLHAAARAVLWLGILAAALQGGFFLRDRAELKELRGRVEALLREQDRGTSRPPVLDEDERMLLRRLGTIVDAGVAGAIPPTDLLRLLADVLPDRVALVALSFEGKAASASLTLEAVAGRASDVTELQAAMAGSPLVSTTELLSERRRQDGSLSVRMQVELAQGRRR